MPAFQNLMLTSDRTLLVQITLTEGVLTGLSTVHRSGEISVGMQEYTARTTIALGTQRITGR